MPMELERLKQELEYILLDYQHLDVLAPYELQYFRWRGPQLIREAQEYFAVKLDKANQNR